MESIALVKVPIPAEVKKLAKEMNVKENALIKAAQRLLLLEILTLESKLTEKEAMKLANKVERSAWRNLQ